MFWITCKKTTGFLALTAFFHSACCHTISLDQIRQMSSGDFNSLMARLEKQSANVNAVPSTIPGQPPLSMDRDHLLGNCKQAWTFTILWHCTNMNLCAESSPCVGQMTRKDVNMLCYRYFAPLFKLRVPMCEQFVWPPA